MRYFLAVRFVACRLVYLCEGSDPPEGTIRRQILVRLMAGGQGSTADRCGTVRCAWNSREDIC